MQIQNIIPTSTYDRGTRIARGQWYPLKLTVHVSHHLVDRCMLTLNLHPPWLQQLTSQHNLSHYYLHSNSNHWHWHSSSPSTPCHVAFLISTHHVPHLSILRLDFSQSQPYRCPSSVVVYINSALIVALEISLSFLITISYKESFVIILIIWP